MTKLKVRARAVDMLGRQQIAGIPTAIHELFKNAHDAYAECEFRGRPATHFGVNRPVIPASSGHPFRCEPASRFGVVRPSFSFFVSGAEA